MPGFNELVEEAARLTQSGEISREDREFVEEFQKVHAALTRVEEKTRQLEAGAGNAGACDVKDAKERIYELLRSLDRLQTSALRNPALQPFARKVAQRARDESKKLETVAQEDLDSEMDKLYEQFKSLE